MFPVYKREAMHCATTSAVRKTKWDTKEDKGKSMMRACGMPKGTSWDEATSNSEKTKPLAIIKLHLSEGRLAGRQLF